MRQEEIICIHDGMQGALKILNNQSVLDYVQRYSIDDIVKDRIRHYDFIDPKHFYSKSGGDISLTPSHELGLLIDKAADDEIIKWFVMLYCISHASELFKGNIVQYLDDEIKAMWVEPTPESTLSFDIREDDLIDTIKQWGSKKFNLETLIATALPQLDMHYREEDSLLGISLFMLTAGYHYEHDKSIIPEIIQRGNGMPFLLSFAQFRTFFTGEDFDEAFKQILDEYGKDGVYDDVLAMVRKNKNILELEEANRNLMESISANNELIRQQETAGEIIYEYFGQKAPENVIAARISKCNSRRNYLYEMEAIWGTRLSFLQEIDSIDQDSSKVEQFINAHKVVLSENELTTPITVEELIDTVAKHESFISSFGNCIINPSQTLEDENYALESKIREVETLLNIEVSRCDVLNANDLIRIANERNIIWKMLVEMIVEKLGVEPAEVTMESSLMNDLGCDSLDVIEVIMEAEKKFKICIPDDEAGECIQTVGDCYHFIIRKIFGKNQE